MMFEGDEPGDKQVEAEWRSKTEAGQTRQFMWKAYPTHRPLRTESSAHTSVRRTSFYISSLEKHDMFDPKRARNASKWNRKRLLSTPLLGFCAWCSHRKAELIVSLQVRSQCCRKGNRQSPLLVLRLRHPPSPAPRSSLQSPDRPQFERWKALSLCLLRTSSVQTSGHCLRVLELLPDPHLSRALVLDDLIRFTCISRAARCSRSTLSNSL